jgi:hypothetical protein
MDNPDTLAILGIQETERRQTNQKTHNTIQQTKKRNVDIANSLGS